jgi:hypothetical protein
VLAVGRHPGILDLIPRVACTENFYVGNRHGRESTSIIIDLSRFWNRVIDLKP